MNLYGFVANSPVHDYDPYGEAMQLSPAAQAVLLNCLKGALISATTDVLIQYGIRCYRARTWKFWETGPPNVYSLVVSASVGCLTGQITGAPPTTLTGLEVLLAKLGAGSVLKWLAKLGC